MTVTYTYDGDNLPNVRAATVELTQSADLGAPSEGLLTVIDAAGTAGIVGQKDFAVDEDLCTDPVAFRGFIASRQIMRGKQAQGSAREIVVNVEGLNAVLGFRGITGSDRKRPAETVAARGAWLIASDYLLGLVVDNGRFLPSADFGMDKADYTDQFPGDVLADMALAQGGVNYYVREFDPYVGPEIVFRDDNASTADTSTIHISNVTGQDDQDTIFYPSKDFTLTRRPDRVKSTIAYQYAKGRVVEERAATAADFNGERFGVVSNSNVKTSAKASDEARVQLWQLHSEEDVLEGSILVPATHANLLNHGDRVGVRLEHMQNLGGPGITTYYDADGWVWCRVLELTRRPKLKPVAKYELSMRLSPQEPAFVPDICDDLYSPTPSDTYYPLGGSGTIPNPSDGIFLYWRAGYEYPSSPDMIGRTDHGWHFPAYGAGGVGTIDYAGDCAQNRLVIVTVGDGEWTIQTERYAGTARTLTVYRSGVLIDTITSGDSVVVTIDDTADGDCIRVVEIRDAGLACGSKWGWSEAVWVAA